MILFFANVIFACLTAIVCGLFLWIASFADARAIPLYLFVAIVNGLAAVFNAAAAVIFARQEIGR